MWLYNSYKICFGTCKLAAKNIFHSLTDGVIKQCYASSKLPWGASKISLWPMIAGGGNLAMHSTQSKHCLLCSTPSLTDWYMQHTWISFPTVWMKYLCHAFCYCFGEIIYTMKRSYTLSALSPKHLPKQTAYIVAAESYLSFFCIWSNNTDNNAFL